MAPSLSPVTIVSAVLVVVALFYQSLTPPPAPATKLTYFDAPGRAEVTRVALRLGNVPFEDERLARDAFLKLKPTLPYGQVPVLTVDGETIAESQAILRFAGRVAGLYPTVNSPASLFLIEEILTSVDEINENFITPTRREKDPEKVKLMRGAAVAGPLTAALEKLEGRLALMTTLPFFQQYANKVLIHEVSVWGMVRFYRSGTLDHVPKTLTDPYATINALHAKVQAALEAVPSESAPQKPTPEIQPVPHPSTLKLTYFDFTGRAEPIRLALSIGGIDFEDERLSRDAFLALKPTLPYGQVPVMTIDGTTVAQTFAMLRCAGIWSGLYPLNDPVEALKIDEILARVEDVYYAFYPSGKETDKDKKRAMREQLAAERIPNVLAMLDKRVAHWNRASPFVLGDDISVADIAVLNLVGFLKSGLVDFVPASIVDEYPNLLAVSDAVLAHPRVVEWYERHA